jgi:hypothetical protein
MDEQQIKSFLEGLKKLADPQQARAIALAKARELAATQKNAKAFDALESQIKKQIKELNLSGKEATTFQEALQDASFELYKLEKVFGKGASVVAAHAKATGKNIDELVEQGEAISKVTDTLTGLGSAAMKGEGSISAFTDNFKNLGVLGSAVAGLGGRLDVNIETFRQLSETGANFGKSITDMRIAAGEARLPLDDFAKLVQSNSEALAALYGNTSAGARAVSQLASGMRKMGIDDLAPLGYTIDEINETMLLNLERQRRTFNFDRTATEQNIKSAIGFAKQLDVMSKLTGIRRDQLRSEIEAQQSNERFQAMLSGQTDETRKRLEVFAASVGKIAPEFAEGIQDIIANGGRPVTDAGIALAQNLQGIGPVLQGLISGTETEFSALQKMVDLSRNSVDKFRRATVTGQVEFLRLQSGAIKLGSKNLDLGKTIDEAGKKTGTLTGGLTTFEDATKTLSSQFQKIETGLLQAFGPGLGLLTTGLQGVMSLLGHAVGALAQFPAITGTAIVAGLAGKFLFDKAAQVLIIATGTKMGFMAAQRGGSIFGSAQSMAGGKKGVGKLGGMALKGAGAVGVGLNAIQGVSQIAGGDTAGGIGNITGSVLGGIIGSIFLPGAGTLIGAAIGGQIGSLVGSSIGGEKRAASGNVNVPAGTVLVNDGSQKEFAVSNASKIMTDVQTGQQIAMAMPNIDMSPLSRQMESMTRVLQSADNRLNQMVSGLNMLVGSGETTARYTKRIAEKPGPYGSAVQIA